jgi:hypothetical protein
MDPAVRIFLTDLTFPSPLHSAVMGLPVDPSTKVRGVHTGTDPDARPPYWDTVTADVAPEVAQVSVAADHRHHADAGRLATSAAMTIAVPRSSG